MIPLRGILEGECREQRDIEIAPEPRGDLFTRIHPGLPAVVVPWR
jgi:hypothetical protein